MKNLRTLKMLIILSVICAGVATSSLRTHAQSQDVEASSNDRRDGKHLFKNEKFGGNGRTCMTCHGRETGTVSPADAQSRFAEDPNDPLFLHDGSDDGHGNGVSRMLKDATILVEIALPDNVSLVDDPAARTVVVRRGIPTTFNTPALDTVLMLDGREPDLETQAANAIRSHFQSIQELDENDLQRIAEIEQSESFFSSKALRKFARGGRAPQLPDGRTESEKRGRLFFLDVPFPLDGSSKAGICAACHSGPMLNETNRFLPVPLPPGQRFQDVLVSEFNRAGNPVIDFLFRNPDGTTTTVSTPDPGRALVTGDPRNFPFDSLNAFKIPSLWGIRNTAPYFHDNSAKTLEDVVKHYKEFFALVTDPSSDGDPALILTDQDMADIVAYLKLLN